CGGNGMQYSNQTCGCFNGFQGALCAEKVCPYGMAWFNVASASNAAHAQAECSARGSCNRETGLCSCSQGFEGGACERLSCPGQGSAGPCNGHGRCITMAAAAAGWDGVTLLRPPVAYTSPWDAYKMQGCVCDEGWYGYDCSLHDCPSG
ncbi:hypothetical protein JKP88DRAFT_153623, partial [Tribonema minus]